MREPQQYSPVELYARYAVAGATCASFAHLILVPIDVVKTRLQVQPGKYHGMGDAFRTMVRQEGVGSILLGLSPTVAGYILQGACKFGFFEFFKARAVDWIGEERAAQNSMKVYLGASAAAEVVGSCFLSPFEALRIRSVAKPLEYGNAGLIGGLSKIAKNEGIGGFYKGLGPLLLKQIPYTTVQLSAFTYIVDTVYGTLDSKYGIRKSEMSKGQQVGVSMACGIAAGVLSSIASHPPDTILSRINMAAKTGKEVQTIGAIVKQLGFKGLWLGVGPRCVFTGLLSATIFLVYDGVKLMFGLKTTAGLNEKKQGSKA